MKYLKAILIIVATIPVFSHLQANNLSLVFIHIGSTCPAEIPVAVKQARLFNTCPIFLLLNASAKNSSAHLFEGIKNFKIITLEDLKRSSFHSVFLAKSALEKGFWVYATERFFYLHEFATQYALENIFHMEYDNMLYVDLEKLFPIFLRHYPHIGATFDNDDRCIPGFIFFKNSNALEDLVTFAAQQASRGLNDMALIGSFHRAYGSKKIKALPIMPSTYSAIHTLKSPRGYTTKNPSFFSTHADLFNSIFDAAALGQYLGGGSPRNGVVPKGFVNESTLVSPLHFEYHWRINEQGLKVPFVKFDGHFYRINNLHIHSKKLEEFYSK